jgi:hypothetical protein
VVAVSCPDSGSAESQIFFAAPAPAPIKINFKR